MRDLEVSQSQLQHLIIAHSLFVHFSPSYFPCSPPSLMYLGIGSHAGAAYMIRISIWEIFDVSFLFGLLF